NADLARYAVDTLVASKIRCVPCGGDRRQVGGRAGLQHVAAVSVPGGRGRDECGGARPRPASDMSSSVPAFLSPRGRSRWPREGSLTYSSAVHSMMSHPAARWGFEIDATEGGTHLRQWATLGPGPSGLTPAIEAMPDKEEWFVAHRLAEHQANMRRCVTGIKELA